MATIKSFEDFLDRMQGLLDNAKKQGQIIVPIEDLENAFPELKDSEDERIRKALLSFCQNRAYNYPNDPKYANIGNWIAWLEKQGKNNMGISEATKQKLEDSLNKALEKETPESYNEFLDEQGEQKLTDKVEPKFHEGDMIIHKELGGDYIHNPHKIIQVDILDEKYRLEGGLVAHFGEQDDYELVEQKPADTEKGAKGNDREIPNSAWSEEDEARFESCIKVLQTSDGYDTINAKWLKNIKDRVCCEVNCTTTKDWSEEDELAFIKSVEALQDFGLFELADWLKEHKSQFLI